MARVVNITLREKRRADARVARSVNRLTSAGVPRDVAVRIARDAASMREWNRVHRQFIEAELRKALGSPTAEVFDLVERALNDNL